MALPFNSMGKSRKVVDFNYPQDVSKAALNDLDKALAKGDGVQTVDALVRYSIAQSGITKDNMPDIVERIETVINKEKQPHIKALLYYFEAQIYEGYRNRYVRWSDRSNPVDEIPADVSEWDRKQFDKKIAELVEKSLAEPDVLHQVAVTSLPEILEYNELGATYVPTLLEFLLMKNLDMLSGSENDNLADRIKAEWLDATDGNAPANIFAIVSTGEGNLRAAYERYRDNEHCGYLLDHFTFDNEKQTYAELKSYLERFPKSIYAVPVQNAIINLEQKSVQSNYPEVISSRDSFTVTTRVRNTNSFWLNVYRAPDDAKEKYRIDANQLQFVSQTPVNVQGTVPFSVNAVKTELPPLPYGYYVVIPLLVDDVTPRNDVFNSDLMHVTDIAGFIVSYDDKKDFIASVDITSGKPLSGVSIIDEKKQSIGTTSGNGMLKLNKANGNEQLILIKGNDHFGPGVYYSKIKNREYDKVEAQFFCDLGVYRPGETIQWAFIAYHATDKENTPLGGKSFQVTFSDTNDEDIDSVKVTSDEFGRFEGSFVVPTDRMNGRFNITLYATENENFIGTWEINVSEYKTPTFEVTFPDAHSSYVTGQPVKVTGKAMTYSGLPVQNSEVRLSLIQNEWTWWWWRVRDNYGEHLMDTTVMTDEQGNFTFEFAPELFKENNGYQPGKRCWAHYNYNVLAIVTDQAGETHEESTSFIVGTRRGIALGQGNNNVYFNDQPIKLPLIYNTTDEEHTDTWCTWEVTPINGQEPVKTGNFNTADPTIDFTDLPSGQYILKIHILDAEEGEQDVDVSRTITLYRKGDKTSPVKDCPLWISPLGKSVDKNNTGHITIGVSTPNAYIYYIASTSDGILREGWLNYKAGMHDFTVPLPKEAGADVTVRFITYYDIESWEKEVTLENPYKPEELKITATSFRDKLVPGNIERWSFTLTDQNGKPRPGAMLLDMYDKAIASIADNDWQYYVYSYAFTPFRIITMNVKGLNYGRASWSQSRMLINTEEQAKLPALYTYGEYPFSYSIGRRERPVMMMKGAAAPMNEGMVVEEDMVHENMLEGRVAGVQPEAAVTEVAFGARIDETTVDEKNLDQVVLRESDVKTALWKPMLTSDENGNIALEFEVPNFNTTWISQAVAWDKQMVGSEWMAEVLTQKPLMVRSNMPRFLRQGDKATLAANVQNATSESATCDAIIELFDPRTNKVYADRKFNLTLAPMGSEAVTIDWQVPDTLAMVGFRIKAANSNFGDGEQVMVPVLTTISPVIETQPFYVEAGHGHFEQPLPDFSADARVTLEYCDNPTWYCVLALPTIWDDNYNIATSAAHSLFALQVAQGVAKSQPQIKEAVTYWKQHTEDSTLVSMLAKNQDLKIGTLLASPWLRESDRQTLRMSKLNELFDEALMAKEYDKIITALQNLQMEDGGFTWFRYPGCISNAWTTGAVLELIGETKHLGYLPDDSRLTSMVNRALSYYDNETLRIYYEALKYNKNPYGMFTNYAYTRTLFPEAKLSDANSSLLKKVLNYMDKNWSRGITLKDKAYYALTLNRNGHQKTARSIIESIRQFAVIKPELGMYWDNLQTGGWWEYDKVAYTSTILQAMNEVDPRQEEIDQVRKWMLLMKQSNDWGTRSLAADAVYTILSTGSQWLERSPNPTITVAGQPLSLDKMAQYLGYFHTTLPATTTGNVVIDRTGNGPAWGAVYSQFKAPMTQIKEVSIKEMSISKEYYVYAQDGTLHSATSFKVGDKVKVRVIIKTNKDMDFVTMTDERAACFEPVNQLSGYRSEDNTWFYQETKDSQTNVFITSLSKGTHIIGYDVWVTNPGEFTSGIATVQCQYAPQLSAHSAGKIIKADAK